mmetsp:Transcript_19982/g.32694  ORF Transcript_19982/g.32694 Transcript_19982/m.32694 type:complete len:343 (-) Transcript_19982:191-1219(-)
MPMDVSNSAASARSTQLSAMSTVPASEGQDGAGQPRALELGGGSLGLVAAAERPQPDPNPVALGRVDRLGVGLQAQLLDLGPHLLGCLVLGEGAHLHDEAGGRGRSCRCGVFAIQQRLGPDAVIAARGRSRLGLVGRLVCQLLRGPLGGLFGHLLRRLHRRPLGGLLGDLGCQRLVLGLGGHRRRIGRLVEWWVLRIGCGRGYRRADRGFRRRYGRQRLARRHRQGRGGVLARDVDGQVHRNRARLGLEDQREAHHAGCHQHGCANEATTGPDAQQLHVIGGTGLGAGLGRLLGRRRVGGVALEEGKQAHRRRLAQWRVGGCGAVVPAVTRGMPCCNTPPTV